MAVQVESSSTGKKAVDAELNLIPFIDLLSVCILFLLMTAVWVQISKMSAFTQPSGEATVQHSETSSTSSQSLHNDFDVIILNYQIEVLEKGQSLGKFKKETFENGIRKLKLRFFKSSAPKIHVKASDEAFYEQVIFVLDTLFAAGLTHLTIGGL